MPTAATPTRNESTPWSRPDRQHEARKFSLVSPAKKHTGETFTSPADRHGLLRDGRLDRPRAKKRPPNSPQETRRQSRESFGTRAKCANHTRKFRAKRPPHFDTITCSTDGTLATDSGSLRSLRVRGALWRLVGHPRDNGPISKVCPRCARTVGGPRWPPSPRGHPGRLGSGCAGPCREHRGSQARPLVAALVSGVHALHCASKRRRPCRRQRRSFGPA